MSLQIKSTSRRRVQFKLPLTATSRADSFQPDFMFRRITKAPLGGKEQFKVQHEGEKKLKEHCL